MDTWDEEVVERWVETISKEAHKQVADSLPKLFKDDPTNLNLILEIIWRNQDTAKEADIKE